MRKFNGGSKKNQLPRGQGATTKIVDGLFPDHGKFPWLEEDKPKDNIIAPSFTKEELLSAAKRLPTGKSPGPDGIPNEILKASVFGKPQQFLELYNKCLLTETFPKI